MVKDRDSKLLVAGAAVVGGVAAGIGGAYDAYGIAKGSEIAYDTHETYSQIDNAFPPDHKRHGNLLMVTAQLTKKHDLDLMNPDDIKILEQNIETEEARLKAVPKPFMPRWMQFTQAQANARGNYETARSDLHRLNSASVELAEYQNELKSHQQGMLAAATRQAGQLDLPQLEAAGHSTNNGAVNLTSKNNPRNAPSRG